MSAFKKFAKLTPIDKRLYFEALFTSIWVKLMVTFLPLRWYATKLGVQHAVTLEKYNEMSSPVIFKISQAIVRCQKSIPWPTRCFVNAITAKTMLKKRGFESTLYLGVCKDNQKMTAHAWLQCGTTFVTGKRGMGKFKIVNTFT